MLLFLAEILLRRFGIALPSAFTYSSTRMMLAALTTLLLTIFLGGKFIKMLFAWKMGQSIRSTEECPTLAKLHSKKKDTPTMGGILILFSLCIALFLWMDLTHVFTIILLLTTLFLGLLGACDDYRKLKFRNSKGLSGRWKFGGQVLFSALIAGYLLTPHAAAAPVAKELHMSSVEGKRVIQTTLLPGPDYIKRLYIPFMKDPICVFPAFLAFFWIIFVITGSSNAVNLTDGLDGLAAGCLLMTASVLGLFAFLSNHSELARYLNILYIEGSGEIGVFLFALAGACLGFLWYNGYPAQVFMGDTGSLPLGGIIGVSAVLLRREVLLAVVGGIFVAEALSVILQVLSYRYRNKQRIFLCAPLHHHFEYQGWPETKVVLRFWIIGLLLALIGIASLKLQ